MLQALKRTKPSPPPLPLEPPGARALRVPVLGTAAYRSEERILIARAADVSLTGAFVATHCPDPVGTRAVLRLELEGAHVELPVNVVRVSFLSDVHGHGAGMGLAFALLDREQRSFVRRYVETMQRWGCGEDAVLELDADECMGIELEDDAGYGAETHSLPLEHDRDFSLGPFCPVL